MPTSERSYQRAQRRSDRVLANLADEIRTARLMAGTSQRSVAAAARISDAKLSRLETGKLRSLTLVDALVVANAVGLDLSCKTYPGRQPTRDSGHARKLHLLLAHVHRPLRHRLEVPLPARDGVPEQRAWDAMLLGPDGATGVELEMRLYDIQAQTRRVVLKWRDSGADRVLLLIADTRANRRVLRTFPEYLAQIPRLKTALLWSLLAAGERPPIGWALV